MPGPGVITGRGPQRLLVTVRDQDADIGPHPLELGPHRRQGSDEDRHAHQRGADGERDHPEDDGESQVPLAQNEGASGDASQPCGVGEEEARPRCGAHLLDGGDVVHAAKGAVYAAAPHLASAV